MPRWALTVAFVFLLSGALLGDEHGQQQNVRYDRDIAPLLARTCWKCHGPDAAQRQAGLRLDLRKAALSRLDSGKTAIVPGSPQTSELIRRLRSRGDDRMPPADAQNQLTPSEVTRLERWIKQGAAWETHWAYQPPRRRPPPRVHRTSWVQSPVDRFILARLERENLAPAPPADRRTLIRRVYLDVIGLPPTSTEVARFLADSRPDAWPRLIDRLLASPRYAPRWARHWLDVARYGDSNGGDENHAYPLAWHYRDYVVAAFNDDLPFDVFLREQLAGDLLPADDGRQHHQQTATGFLALGTKILAEKDKAKMRADMVDEQIDTLGKAFLGLTLGCARCHDHKFDPITTREYYALAGILHSTRVGNQSLQSTRFRAAEKTFKRRLAELTAERSRLQRKLQDSGAAFIDVQAEKFDRGNVSRIMDGYGKGIGVISDPGSQNNFAEYDLQLPAKGQYLVQLRYAARNARPGRLLINGKVVNDRAIREVTGGWMPEHQRWFTEGAYTFRQGANVLRLESKPLMSHIDRIRLIRAEQRGALGTLWDQLQDLDQRLAKLQRNPPKPINVMAAQEGMVANVRLHQRGSHLQLGEEVPRGVPGAVAPASASRPADKKAIGGKQSGRLQLVQWMTDVQGGAGGLAARVVANRLWHWHFGRGIVGTPNNLGVRGQRPTHPALLDWLARQLVDDQWSLKALHRHILLSATYQQAASTDGNRLYRGVPRRRLDAEVIRDSLLWSADRLDDALFGPPLKVKAQDPSPADLHKNEQAYRNARRRSVFLPVVRSNVSRFLSLFDFPNAATPVGRRDATTVPTQALLLLNDPFVLDQAGHLAKRLLQNQDLDSDGKRVVAVYERLYGRPPGKGEREVAQAFLREFASTVQESSDPALAAWSSLCHTLMLSNEFVYVE